MFSDYRYSPVRNLIDILGKILLFWAAYNLPYHKSLLTGSTMAGFGLLVALAVVGSACFTLFDERRWSGPIGVACGIAIGIIMTVVIINLDLVWWKAILGLVVLVVLTAHTLYMAFVRIIRVTS